MFRPFVTSWRQLCCETKLQLVVRWCTSLNVICAWLYTRVHWMATTVRYCSESKHHAGAIPDHLLSCFKEAQVLKKYRNKFYCLVKEMLYMEQLRRPHWDCVIGLNPCCLSLCLAFLFFKMQSKSSFKSFLTRIYPPPKQRKQQQQSHD